MRIPAAGPADVQRYLLPHERRVVSVRQHPAVLMGAAALTLGGLIIAAALNTTVLRHEPATVKNVIWLAWLLLLLRLGWKVGEWAVTYFIVTSSRMIQTSGLVTRKVAMMPMSKVTDMSFQRSFLGRLLGYGEFILESAGQDQALSTVSYIPYPEQLYLEVCAVLFPESARPPSLPNSSADDGE